MFSLFANANQQISVKELTMSIPDNYESVSSKGTLLYYADKNSENCFILSCLNIHDFSPSKVLSSLDTELYELSDYKLLKTENEWFFQWDKDYVKRFYEGNDGKKYLTYTFYSSAWPYCIFFKYESNEDLEKINKIIDSISINEKWPQQLFRTYKNAEGWWIIYFILIGIIGYVFHDDNDTVSAAFGIAIIVSALSPFVLLITTHTSLILILSMIILSFIDVFFCCACGVYLTLGDD